MAQGDERRWSSRSWAAAMLTPLRYWACFLLNNRYLFDLPTALAHLKKMGKLRRHTPCS
jgi:hypothetical protein